MQATETKIKIVAIKTKIDQTKYLQNALFPHVDG